MGIWAVLVSWHPQEHCSPPNHAPSGLCLPHTGLSSRTPSLCGHSPPTILGSTFPNQSVFGVKHLASSQPPTTPLTDHCSVPAPDSQGEGLCSGGIKSTISTVVTVNPTYPCFMFLLAYLLNPSLAKGMRRM